MKNKKLNISELKVKSFVTDLEKEKANTANGGGYTTADSGSGTFGQTNRTDCNTVAPNLALCVINANF